MSGEIREERKVVTALFADVVGSTRLTEQLDPEDAREVLGTAVRKMVEAVETFGGTVKDLAGDGVLALFGAPIAHEDDAERAVRAALRIVREREAERSSDAAAPSVRVGIETGLVVLGPVGAGGRVEYGATGDAINTAARLQSHAPPGGIFVGDVTRRAVEDRFELGSPVRLELKGKSEPVSAFEVLGERAGPRSAPILGRMVGRERDLERAMRIADVALGGDGGLLLVIGEPGIGKSRLVDELRARVGETALMWIEGRCVSFGESTPYLPLRDVILNALGFPDASPIGPHVLAMRVRSFDPELDDAVPYLAAALGVADDGTRALSSETLRLRTIESLRRLFATLAARGPVVVAIEDVHWADASTLHVLERLIPSSRGVPVLFVLTSRSAEAARMTAGRGVNSEVVELASLPPERLDELVNALLEGGEIPIELRRRVVETAGGNPFFASELVRSLMASGILERDGATWVLTDPTATVELPTTIEKVILARLDLLERSTRNVITAASVLGRTVALPLLERLVGADVTSESNALVQARLFELDGRPDEVSFAHALIQEVAYGSLLKRRRRELHAAAAAAIEDVLVDRLDENLGVLAYHHRRAGDLEAARRCHDLAADRAERVHAGEEALEHLSASIEIAAELGRTATDRDVAERFLARARVRARTGDAAGARADLETILAHDAAPEVAMRAHDELGFVLAGAADYRAALPHLETALQTATALGDATGEVSALSRLSLVHANRLDFEAALGYGERALASARASGDERAEAVVMDAVKQTALETGDFDTLEQLAGRLVEIHRRNDDLWLLQFALLEAGYADVGRMRLDGAFARLEEAFSICRRIGDAGNEPLYLTLLGRAHRGRGQYDEALELEQRSFHLARELGHHEFTSWAAAWLGSTFLELDAFDEAVEVLSVGVEAADRSAADLHLVRCLGMNAWATWRVGDNDRAVELADRATSILDRIRVRPPRAYVAGHDAYVGVAKVRLERGDVAGAVKLISPIVEACRACGWCDGIVDGSLVVADAALRQGDIAAATGAAESAVAEAVRVGLPTALRAHRTLAEAYRAAGDEQRAALHSAEAETASARIAERIDDRAIREAFISAAMAQAER
jgi:class 3 adenylate cyclase/tetratricopeptide (TPR) repeat protein